MVLSLGMVTTCLPKAKDSHHMSAWALDLLGLGPSERLGVGPFGPKRMPTLHKDPSGPGIGTLRAFPVGPALT